MRKSHVIVKYDLRRHTYRIYSPTDNTHSVCLVSTSALFTSLFHDELLNLYWERWYRLPIDNHSNTMSINVDVFDVRRKVDNSKRYYSLNQWL
jgi:hypothetical protein